MYMLHSWYEIRSLCGFRFNTVFISRPLLKRRYIFADYSIEELNKTTRNEARAGRCASLYEIITFQARLYHKTHISFLVFAKILM